MKKLLLSLLFVGSMSTSALAHTEYTKIPLFGGGWTYGPPVPHTHVETTDESHLGGPGGPIPSTNAETRRQEEAKRQAEARRREEARRQAEARRREREEREAKAKRNEELADDIVKLLDGIFESKNKKETQRQSSSESGGAVPGRVLEATVLESGGAVPGGVFSRGGTAK